MQLTTFKLINSHTHYTFTQYKTTGKIKKLNSLFIFLLTNKITTKKRNKLKKTRVLYTLFLLNK